MEINVVMEKSDWRPQDLEVLFGEEDVRFSKAQDYPSLLRDLGVYQSSSAARRAGRTGPIPKGFSCKKASKKHRLWIWNPTKPGATLADRLILNGAVSINRVKVTNPKMMVLDKELREYVEEET